MDHLRDNLGGLPTPKEAAYVWKDIWHLEAHHSTALEGNTLIMREVTELLDRGKAVGAKPLREYMEVTGYGRAAQWVYEQAASEGTQSSDRFLISVTEVRYIHEQSMTPVWTVEPHPEASGAEAPGHFRRHDITPFSQGMTPPSWVLVPERLDRWVEQANALVEPSDSPIAERLAQVHNAFEQVHPFIDGNGRAGRLSLNLILVRLGYPPVIVLKQNRGKYLDAIQKADSGDFGPLGEQLARAMTENLDRFILPNVAGPARLVPLSSLSDEDLSKVALRQVAQRGRLDAEQRADGTWYSSRTAVEEYKASRYRRRSGA